MIQTGHALISKQTSIGIRAELPGERLTALAIKSMFKEDNNVE